METIVQVKCQTSASNVMGHRAHVIGKIASAFRKDNNINLQPRWSRNWTLLLLPFLDYHLLRHDAYCLGMAL